MADFPAYSSVPYTADSQEQFLDDLRVDAATDGTVRSRALYSAPRRRFTLKGLLTATEWATLKAHYLANRASTFNFTWAGDGATYVCWYEAAPTTSYKASMVNYSVALRTA